MPKGRGCGMTGDARLRLRTCLEFLWSPAAIDGSFGRVAGGQRRRMPAPPWAQNFRDGSGAAVHEVVTSLPGGWAYSEGPRWWGGERLSRPQPYALAGPMPVLSALESAAGSVTTRCPS